VTDKNKDHEVFPKGIEHSGTSRNGLPEHRLTLAPASDETVTICAWTRQVRHRGEWLSLEEFLVRRFGVGITHGISAAAAEAQLHEFLRTFDWRPAPVPQDS
jgi:hypothetical protein